ncbi:multidrug effflux MFS transporter [Gibbsiella quercinecans]|uniref:multidrug effflux MFS transporter n=1 Tax=Gibbsiella quercinecans TaxID=929813 RepID=UPI0015FF6175|nr:multidrug effflux MFS transporter [Gibbsiella quercinecans]
MIKNKAPGLPLITTLAVVTAFDAMAIDMYLPAFAAIGDELNADAGSMQGTLSVFLVGLALGQLFYGPLADRFGRRRPLIVGVVLFIAATVYAAVAQDITSFMTGRFFQGLGGAAGLVIPRAIVADMCDGHQSARIFSLLIQIMMIAPVAAPLAGGVLLSISGWHLTFYVLAAIGVFSLLAVLRFVPETLSKENQSKGGLAHALSGYGQLFRQPAFMGWTLSGSFAIAGLFAYIGASSFIYTTLFGLSPAVYSFVFAVNAAGMILTGYVNALLLRYRTARQVLSVGLVLHIVVLAVLVGTVLSGVSDVYMTGVLIFISVSALSLILGNVTALIMASNTGSHGSSSSLFGVLQYVLAGVAGGVMGMAGNGTLLPPVLIMLFCALAAAVFNCISTRVHLPVQTASTGRDI